METDKMNRQYDMDWMRVLATMGVFLYHCSMFFNPFPWHVKNNVINSGSILAFSLFLGSWMMPIFFAVSGISVYYALQKRSPAAFLKERLVRLGIPLLFGVFILTPPQVFAERVTHHQYQGTLLSFLPHYFDGVYLDIGGTGNFAFFGLHLWYLLVLLLFSLIALPLFKKVRGARNLGNKYFMILPFLLFFIGIIKTQALGGWDLVFYLLIFLYGYYFFASPAFRPAIQASFKIYFPLAVITSLVFIGWFMKAAPVPGSWEDILFYAVRTLNCWSWLMCIFNWADRHLSHSNRFLKYGSEASMPFYVLHQPVIVMLGYFIHDLSWSVPIKLIFLLTAAFTINMACYHFVIRQITWLRVLFGMKGSRQVIQKDTSPQIPVWPRE